MLISHSHTFIFLREMKTASTAVEFALSINCRGNLDVIGPMDDEGRHVFWKEFDLPKPKNYALPVRAWNWSKLRKFALGGVMVGAKVSRPLFVNHESPDIILRAIGKRRFESYTRISTLRNPFHRIHSLYRWQTRDHHEARTPEMFSRWFKESEASLYFFLTRSRILDGKDIVDRYLRFEALQEDFRLMTHELSLDPRGIEVLRRLRPKASISNSASTVQRDFALNPDISKWTLQNLSHDFDLGDYARDP